MTLSGSTLDRKASIWGGMVALGASTNAGTWALTPEVTTVGFSFGGKSGRGKHGQAGPGRRS